MRFMVEEMGFQREEIQRGIVGGAFDGAYLANGGTNVSLSLKNFFTVILQSQSPLRKMSINLEYVVLYVD